MKPINYTKVDNGFIFIYDEKDLKEFHNYGKQFGNNGWYVVSEVSGIRRYSGYGTIEHPLKKCIDISIGVMPDFDGVCDPDIMCGFKESIKPANNSVSYRMIILDFGKTDDTNIVKVNKKEQ